MKAKLDKVKTNEILEVILEHMIEKIAWLELAENQFKKSGENWLTYYALLRHEIL